ncbi:uncharacterized protein TRAVEDRAFT_54012 [Trametes versicolor FP-101664 SS1]|uniref:Mid2 domain-containing protein n=1 Tax=Trametes versicolor (strain FP-101664) TaxID=717944 RepID=R7S8Q0_TRAVS|nr:uncharacterized protein TRAVEDRAFT_54012 [Trametes versicolor FP-101664 SS1]EIW52032.1 hypothetical protein TRAVEDRAFT_54012 [Trametes versicolor FP-101664 SS1]
MATSLVILALGTLPGRVQGLSVNTPQHVTQCESTTIKWNGGVGPYDLTISPPDSDPQNVVSFSGLTGLTFSWDTNKPTGSNLTIFLTDGNDGTLAQSSPFIVGPSQDDSCLGSQPGGSSTPPITTTSTTITTSSSSLDTIDSAPTPTPSSSSRPSTSNPRQPPTSSPSTSAVSTSVIAGSSKSTAATSGAERTNSNATSTPPISISSASYNTTSSAQGTPSDPTLSPMTSAARAQSPPTTTSIGLPEPSQSTAERHTLSTGAVVGIAVGSFGSIISLLVCWLICRRRRAAAPAKSSGVVKVPVFPPQPTTPSAKGAHLRPEHSRSTESTPRLPAQTHSSQQSHREVLHSATDPPPPPVERAQSIVPSDRYSALVALAGAAPPVSIALLQRTSNSAQSARTPQSLPATREPRYETDGGVRLAGGPLGAALDDDVLSDVHSTFPPPYDTY